MNRMREGTSKDLGRRAFGTAWGGKTPGKAPEPERFGEVIDLEEEIRSKPIALPLSRAWKPRAGRIYTFPMKRIPDEK